MSAVDPVSETELKNNDLSVSQSVEIVNVRGLHARASAKFVKTVEQFQSVVKVSKDGETVGGRSIMGLMMLAAGPQSFIEITATGADAEDALQALVQLVSSKFGEEE